MAGRGGVRRVQKFLLKYVRVWLYKYTKEQDVLEVGDGPAVVFSHGAIVAPITPPRP